MNDYICTSNLTILRFIIHPLTLPNKLAKDDLIEVEIIDINSEGKGIAKPKDDRIIFVDNSVIGDRLRTKIKRIKRKYAEAIIEEIISGSPDRVAPECTHFGLCNGCKMQHIDYPAQLKIKKQHVVNAFVRIGGFSDVKVNDVIGFEQIFHYRNKIEFSFSNDRWLTEQDLGKDLSDKNFALGYHIPGFVDKVFDVNECLIQPQLNNSILNFTREFLKSKKIPVYSSRSHTGFLRYLIIRNSPVSNETMINLITSEEDESLINDYGLSLNINFPDVTTFVHSVSCKRAQTAQFDYYKTIFGNGFINEKIGEYFFKITPGTFFQTNTSGAKILFDTVLKLAEFKGTENVLDLYCGCGAISIYISKLVHSVHGVELSEESIKGAVENASQNIVFNCTFETSDVKDYLHSLISTRNSKFSTLILDPPRSGIHPKAAEYLLQLNIPDIIYVSCNPATQARDIASIKDKYEIVNIQPVDMFPHTNHIENVVKLKLKS